MTAEWTTRAELELQQIIDHIADDDPVAAYEWGQRLMDRADAAAGMKHSGRVVPEVGRVDIREVFVGAYRIMYRVTRNGIRVITVLEGHMLHPADVNLDE